jgi:glyoxylase-like metal-dependent hydrolase (beta-lactamase superfamily II)
MRLTILAAAFSILAAPAAAQLVKPEGLRPVSRHVQVIPDNSVPVVPSVGIVVGRTGVLVVDTGLGPKNGALVAEAAMKAAPGRQLYLVTTHVHPEHDLGAQAFPSSTKLIRSREQVAEIEAQGLGLAKVFAGRSPQMAELLQGAEFRKADVVFSGSYSLDLGGVTARIDARGPAHTAGDTTVWVEPDRVLFSGDLAMKAQPAMMAPDGTLATWNRALDGMARLKPLVVVPSHGPVGDAGFITGYSDYLKEVGQRTAAAKKAGVTLEQATAQVADAMAGRYPDRGRLAGAVRVAWGR